jgi:hypothetical protein
MAAADFFRRENLQQKKFHLDALGGPGLPDFNR